MSDIVLTCRRSVQSAAIAENRRSDHQHPDQACHRQAGQFGPRQSDQLLHGAGPDQPRQRPRQPARLDVERHQHDPGRQQRHHLDHQAGAIGPGAGRARRSRPPTPRCGPALPPSSTRILGQIDQLAGDSSFNGINLLDSTNSANLTVTLNESGSSTVTINAVDFTVDRPRAEQLVQQLGRPRPTSRWPAPT